MDFLTLMGYLLCVMAGGLGVAGFRLWRPGPFLKQNKKRWGAKGHLIPVTEALEEAVFEFDPTGLLLFANSRGRELFETKTPAPRVPGLQDLKNFSPGISEIFNEGLKTGQTLFKSCSFHKPHQNFKTHFKIKAVPVLKTHSSTVRSVILIFYDQTKSHLSRRSHIDFISNVSHELKSPLTSLQGFVEVLIQDLKNKKFDQFESFLQVLLKNCKRMNDLVNDLLNLSVLATKTNLKKEKLNTKTLTEKVVENLKTENHKLHYVFKAPYVMAHPRWVETVLHNLVENACLHTPQGCDIHIRWEFFKNGVVLKVADNGSGIPEKYRHRVFERFFRVEKSRTRDKGGSGVGLALVQQAIEKHGGYVRVLTSPSGGSEFVCQFPDT